MATRHLAVLRTTFAAAALATVMGASAANAQYGGGYGPPPGYGYGPGYGSGPGYGYAPAPSYGNESGRYSPTYRPPHGDLYHALCEGNAAGFDDWQTDHLGRYIKLDDNQKELLAAVKDAAAKAAVSTHAACPGDLPLTWSGQLETMQGRIEAMLAALQTLRPAVDAFVGSLSDEQKARLNGIGFARYR